MKNRRTYYQGLWVVLLFFSPHLHAQYEGGDADGFTQTTVLQLDLSGIPAGVRALYSGGIDDGAANQHHFGTPSGVELTIVYSGSQGDGFDQQIVTSVLDGTDLAALFTGGFGDGFDREIHVATLGGQDVTGLFSGGSGDGFDGLSISQTLAGVSLTGIYAGGSGDGFDRQQFTGDLIGEMLMLYGGGDGDGFDKSIVGSTISGTSLAMLFRGGEGDGFDVSRYDGVVPLPLTLISFEAIPEATFVLLRWITEDELDTDFFTIEKTKEGTEYSWVGETEAAGFSEPGERLHYELRDEDPWQGTSFYRLKTTDFDGAISLSHLVEVQYNQPGKTHSFTLFPNPNTGLHFSLRLEGYEPEELCYFEVFNLHGQAVFKGQFYPGAEPEHRFELPRALSSGSYLIRLRSENGKVDSKILLVK